jgi:hypothetical protein
MRLSETVNTCSLQKGTGVSGRKRDSRKEYQR